MNRKIIIALLIAGFIGVYAYYSFQQVSPDEIENAPEWIPLETAQKQASDQNKLIMIDIYEVGCQYCRAMEREVYPSPSVRAVLDRDFVPVKINGHSENTVIYKGEEMTEQQFASQMGVTAYPFTVIMDGEGNVIDSRRGYMNIVNFSRFLRDSVEKAT
ncbi:thioredoxin family protein [Rhodohalobacter sp. 614A]|uniref:thioredoxin family protein n=1 Tax=Rhodohalobacter sp. 614A TaxID=2908649 RepID=UPI001F15C4C9|nr:thioredoxin fold domain-containing protein [Rhodohalobacter sp. 614A]